MAANPQQIYEFGPFRLDLAERLLTRKGKPVALTPKAFEVLVFLMERKGHLVEKDELMREVWADSIVEEANLSRTIWMLRQALGDEKNGHGMILTVPKHGYRFVADVTAISVADTGSVGRSRSIEAGGFPTVPFEQSLDTQIHDVSKPSSEAATSRTPIWHRHRFLIVTALLILIVAVASVAFVYLSRIRREPAQVQASIKSMAVLPLENRSGDSAQEYLADGVTEGLIASVSRAKTLRVTSPKAAMPYKGTSKSLAQIARELGVDALVIGSFVSDGKGVQIESRLVDPAADVTLWSNSYSRSLGDIWALQNEIARELIAKVEMETQPELNVEPQVNPEAYDLYLRGRFRVSDDNPENIRKAIDFQERATRLDQTFALAYAELAQLCNLYAFYYAPKEEEWEEKAFVAAERAIRLRPDLPDAHLVRGHLLWTQRHAFPHEQAIQEYKQALELNPSLDESRYQLGRIYMHVGLFDKAIAEYQLALSISPTHVITRLRLAVVANFQHKYEESLKMQDSLPADLKAATLNYQRAWSLCHLNRHSEASSLVETWRKSNTKDEEGGLLTSIQALLAAHNGNEHEVEKYAKLSIEHGSKFGHFHHSAYTIAAAYAIVNKPEKAIKWLQFAADNGFPNYPLFANDPDLENLRLEPSYNEFMQEQKEQWELRMKSY